MRPRSGFTPGWPARLSAYSYTRDLTPSRWGWEYLRRNELYGRDWIARREALPRAFELTPSARLIRVRRRSENAEGWGLHFLADPRLDALEADVFWRREAYGRVLTALVSRHHRPSLNSPISLDSMPCRKAILIDATGDEHLLLRDRRHVLQILCQGDSIAAEPCAIGLVAHYPFRPEPHIRLLRRFAALNRPGKADDASAALTPSSLRLRNSLVALDGWINGASYREIALAIHGPDFVRENWGGGQRALKDRMIRLVRKGRHLMDGGYRELLR